ncbi:MAG: hypothetical protein O3C32_02350 [Bacteroidetes bacterium]|nr:hypothetical protein [Bacteroidota bacterium]
MKTKFSVWSACLFLLMGLAVRGQITINSTHMPGSGDTLRYSLAEASSVNTTALNSSGANQTWDFSQLIPQSQGLNEYKLALQINPAYSLFFGLTAYGLKTFDTLNLGTIQLTNGYDFLTKNSSVYKAVGRGLTFQNLPVPSFYSDDDEIYQFPLQYGDNDSSTFRVAFDLGGTIGLVQKGSRRNKVTGWGSITTPFGTFNALKVETTIWQTDSISLNGFGLPPIPSTRVWYSWWSTAEEMPIMEARGNVLPFSTQPVFTEYRFRDVFRPCLGYVVADFTANQTQGTTADVFQLQDASQCAPETYFWNVQPGTYTWMNGSTATDPNPSIRFDAAGYYSLGLSVVKGFSIDTEQKTDYILISQSSTDAFSSPTIQLYPNPVEQGQKSVVECPGQFKFSVLNGLGQQLSISDGHVDRAELSTLGLKNGLHWVQIQQENGAVLRVLPLMVH